MLSIIIPVYNSGKFINSCVRKLCAQTYQDLEIILINDGSTDNTLSVCEDIISEYQNVHVYTQENKGPGKARELGLSKATGEFVTFVDVDDYIDDHAYATVLEIMAQKNCDIIQFGCTRVDDDGAVISKHPPKETDIQGNRAAYESFVRLDNCTSFLWDKVFRRELFEKAEWPQLYYSEDYYVLAQVYSYANHVVTIPDCFYYYVQHTGSACSKPFSIRRLDIMTAGKYVVELTRSKFPECLPYALSYVVEYSARLAESAYLSDFSGNAAVVSSLVKDFKKYFREMMYYSKKEHKKVGVGKRVLAFRISPYTALKIRKYLLNKKTGV